ncbi:MAG: Gfo/Idh/MocA family oxidoreductase [Acidobacteria bacterium]|nr:Gfo/Idh/MocA family oxidoreductase [Acidobacteriota bacterium]
MSPPTLKGVMIGAGYFAQFHAEGWNRTPGAAIAAIADATPGRASEFAAKWNISRADADVEAMLDREKPDFVDIVTRPESHAPLTELAARNGIHVICQKPMAPAWEDCLAMVAACKKAGVRLLIHENWRWQPWYREAKRVMDSGALGKPYHLAFRHRADDGLGPAPYSLQPYFAQMPRLLVYETLVHHLDTSRYLAGEIDSLYCQMKRVNPVIAGEDCVMIQLTFASGIQGLIDGNRISGKVPSSLAMGSFRVEGDKGMIRCSSGGRLFLTQHGKDETALPSVTPPAGYRGDSIRAAQEHYIACLQTGQRCESEGEDYLKTVAAVEACYQSAAKGQVVRIEDGRLRIED